MKLEIKDMHYRYGNNRLFQGINICHDLATPLCIVGATGSGKSTLGELILGLIKPQRGIINLDGNCLLALQNAENQLFYNHIYKDIMFGCNNYNISKDTAHKRLKELLLAFNLGEDVLNKSPETLSQGQLKKIAIISILILRPEVLVLDEPTLGLDVNSKIAILEYLNKYSIENDIHLIFITHDPDIIKFFNPNIIKLQKGEIQFDGSYEEFLKFCINNNYLAYLSIETQLLIKFNVSCKKELYEVISSR